MSRHRPRPALFALAAAALLGSAMLLGLREEEPAGREPPARAPALPAGRTHRPDRALGWRGGPRGEDLAPGRRPSPALRAGQRAVAVAARRFLAAFLPYEVGRADAHVRRALRATATEELATTLLAAPPRPAAAGVPRRAHLLSLQVTLDAGVAPRAVVSGRLRRSGETEAFAFLFERHAGGWLAAGVAE